MSLSTVASGELCRKSSAIGTAFILGPIAGRKMLYSIVYLAALQENDVINIQVEQVSLDSTTVKVHPDGTGALKKRSTVDGSIPSRVDNEDS